MIIKRVLFLLFILFFYRGFSYAGELTAPDAVTHYNGGVKAQKALNFEGAEIEYRKALLLDPNNTNLQKFILNNRGLMYVKIGDPDRAEVSFRAALQIDPDYQPAKVNYSLIGERHRTKLESLAYWLKYFKIDLEAMKPKDFVLAETQKE